MTLNAIFVFAALGLVYGLIVKRWRTPIALTISLAALFALQPSTPLRDWGFWFPVLSLSLTGLVWAYCQSPGRDQLKPTLLTVGLAALVAAGVALSRDSLIQTWVLSARPPAIGGALMGLIIAAALTVGLSVVLSRRGPASRGLMTAVALLVAALVVLKFEPLAALLSAGLRLAGGQSAAEASALDLRWLGASYITFRLIHMLREKNNKKLPAMNLAECWTYVLFFPALVAGPIDRGDRFLKDLRAPAAPDSAAITEGLYRILIGAIKKFALADTLALIALNDINAAQTRSAGWTWVLLYAYALRIYFDFSGYTDIALGLARLFGVKLPENFNAPYLKPNITQFWNSWHMSLSQWFRAYWFNPLTRWLRGVKRPDGVALSQGAMVFIGQTSTMLLIAAWHGITVNFLIWGAWHALGLFVHSRWAEYAKRADLSRYARAGAVLGPLATFHFVALGWVWFALAQPGTAAQVLLRLFGGGR